MRERGVYVDPIVRELLVRFSNEAASACEMNDLMLRKFIQLEAQHLQLEMDFNSYCNDKHPKKTNWMGKAYDATIDRISKEADAFVQESRERRQETVITLEESLRMNNKILKAEAEIQEQSRKIQDLEAEIARLRALKVEVECGKCSLTLTPASFNNITNDLQLN